MISNDEKRGWLEAIKELKTQYYIGSQSAFRYLKEARQYEKIRQEVIQKNPGLLNKHDLSVQKIACLTETLGGLIGCKLTLLSTQMSTPQSFSLRTLHSVITPSASRKDDDESNIPDWLKYFPWTTYTWSANIADFLSHFLEVLPPWYNDERRIRSLLESILPAFLVGGLKLYSAETGEQVSYERFRRDTTYRKGEPEYMWDNIRFMLDKNQSDSDWEGYLLDMDVDERITLELALMTNDVSSAHPIWQSLEIRQIRSEIEVLIQNWASYTGMPAEDWLYDPDLYKRAEREYTLGYTEIERRIALNLVRSHDDWLKECESTGVFLDRVVNHQRERIKQTAKRLDSVRLLNAPQPIIDNFSADLQSKRYTFTALHQNRKWLIDFLSR